MPVILPVTSSSTQVLRATEPSVPSVRPSMAGWAFQVTAVSDQVVLDISFQVPPLLLSAPATSSTWSRSLALVTGSVSPLTVNLRNDALDLGRVDTDARPLVPKLVVGALSATYVSATGVKVTVAAAAEAASEEHGGGAGARGQRECGDADGSVPGGTRQHGRSLLVNVGVKPLRNVGGVVRH